MSSSTSSSGKETRTPGRSPTKDSLLPIVLVEDLPSTITNNNNMNNKGDSDPETTRLDVSVPRRNGTSSYTGGVGGGSNFKFEDLLPDSELLGSVTFAPVRSSSVPVRTSARVIQKMRLDNRPSTPPTVSLGDGPSGLPTIPSSTSTYAGNPSLSSSTAGAVTVAAGGQASNHPANASAAAGGSGTAATGTHGNRSEKAVSAPKTPTTQSKQPKRLWSNMERSLFFEALNEYGKDFEAITQHINQKMRRKVFGAENSCKSREQVRHLYLQTFQKASRYLRFSDDVKKVPQELYALINYGEMRRKLPFMHEKAFMKLKELVYRGSVTIREKGKAVRIRTPSCRALKKLNQLEEWQEEVTLPQRIEINLIPATMESWGRVQNLAQNPRIKTTLPLYKRVSCLLKFLQNKWRSQEMRLCEKTMPTISSSGRSNKTATSSATNASSSGNTITTTSSHKAPRVPPIDHHHELFDELANAEPFLCLAPPAKTIIHRPMVNLTDFSNSYSICLNSYEDRIGATIRGEELPVEKFLTHRERAMNGKRLRLDSGGEGGGGGAKKTAIVTEKEQKKGGKGESNSDGETSKGVVFGMDVVQSEEELARPNSPVNADIQMMDFSVISAEDRDDRIDLFSDNSEDKRLVEAEVKETVQQQQQQPGTGQKTATSSRKGSGKVEGSSGGGGSSTKGSSRAAASFRPLISDEVIRKIKEGWTVKNCGDLTFGDLYVMFGNDFKIHLEYRWLAREVVEGRGEEPEVVGVQEVGEGTTLTATAATTVKEEKDPLEMDKEVEQLMGRRLGQLLLIANLMEKSVKKKECVCDRGGKMKENDYPYPESNLFKHPALPLRYSHYNGYNSMLHLRRQKPRQVYPFPSPKPFMSAPKYYGRPSYARPPLPLHEEEGRDGDAEDDGEEGPSSRLSRSSRQNDDFAAGAAAVPMVNGSGVVVTGMEVTSTTGVVSTDGDEEDEAEETEEDEEEETEEEEGDMQQQQQQLGEYSKNPGLLSLLDISLPSIREEELLRGTECGGDRQGWLEDNMNDYSFSSLLGHIDMHLNSARGEAENNRDSENGSTTAGEEESPEKVAGKGVSLLSATGSGGQGGGGAGGLMVLGGSRSDMMSDRCSVISETSVDFVKKFAEMAGMIEDR